MQTQFKIRTATLTLLLIAGSVVSSGFAQFDRDPARLTNSDLASPATWGPPDRSEIENAIYEWLKGTNASAETLQRVRALLSNGISGQRSGEPLDLIVDCLAIAHPEVNHLRELLREQRSSSLAPKFSSLLDNPDEHEFLRHHVRLYLARWLAQNEFYDESFEHLQKINIEQVLDPTSLLFYRGLMAHQLLRKQDCVKTINQLLENSDVLPRRYEVLSRLMLADIQPLETDSLDEISRMMGDIRRRTGLNRSGKLVLGREEQVIEKLNKLIEKLEAQQQAQPAGGNPAPSAPMKDSIQAPGKGSGQVTSKQIKDGGSWGDLPPAQRAAALADMAKDMPPHYREVIEEYFRRLARESDR